MTRREWLQAVSAAVTLPLLASADPTRPLFFTKDEFALLDTLTELVIPEDGHSPGARAAGVAKFIDFVTAQTFPGEGRDSWSKGLKKVDDDAKERYGSKFVELDPAKQTALLKNMDQRNDPFFGQLKDTTAFAYYSTSIGIHQEMGYLGNVLQEQFSGYEV